MISPHLVHGCTSRLRKMRGPTKCRCQKHVQRQLAHRPVRRRRSLALAPAPKRPLLPSRDPQPYGLSRENVVVGFAGNSSVDTKYGAHFEGEVRWLPPRSLRVLHVWLIILQGQDTPRVLNRSCLFCSCHASCVIRYVLGCEHSFPSSTLLVAFKAFPGSEPFIGSHEWPASFFEVLRHTATQETTSRS